MKQEDIGLIAGGNEIGTIYSNAIINIKNGNVGKIIGGIMQTQVIDQHLGHIH